MLSKEKKLLNKIDSEFDIDGKVEKERRLSICIGNEKLIKLCRWLKNTGFSHLSAISVTDWPEDSVYELTYHVWSYENKILITVRTKIDREDPEIPSVVQIWKENAQIHERELHELFGVHFKGNKDLNPLFLEGWTGPPPFRKDFDWREYVRNEFYDEENERERVYFE